MNNIPLYFAGSFNPIHHGHLVIARAAAEAAGCGKVVILPSAQNPLKKGDTASCEDRLNMCRLAVAGMPGFEVSDLELRRPGPSFTIDTMEALRFQGETDIFWLLGADQILHLPKWREIDRLLAEVRFVIAGRPGYAIEWAALPAQFAQLEKQVIKAPLVEISATDIRWRVANQLAIDYLTPANVVRYIREKDLYR